MNAISLKVTMIMDFINRNQEASGPKEALLILSFSPVQYTCVRLLQVWFGNGLRHKSFEWARFGIAKQSTRANFSEMS